MGHINSSDVRWVIKFGAGVVPVSGINVNFLKRSGKMMRKANFGFVMLVVMVFLALPSFGQAGDPNLVAHWAFDEGAGVIAYDSAGGNDGNFVGDPCWTSGRINGALEFDGVDDYISCGTGPAITGIGPFAVSAWVKSDIVKEHAVVVQRSAASANGSYGVSILDDGRVQFYVYDGAIGFKLRSNLTVDDGLWHHVAAVRINSTDGEIYVDGSLSATGSGPARSLNSVAVWIGGPGFTGPFRFDGAIDDVRIYNSALSAEEVERLYWEGFGDLELAIMQIEKAVAEKEGALESIESALERELVAYGALEEVFSSGDYGDLSKRDIAAAQRKIDSSIRRQERSQRVVLDSIDELKDALLSLGWEPPGPEPNVPEPEPNVPEPNVPVPGNLLKGSRVQR